MLNNLISVAGAGWVWALVAAFVSMILESARPKREDGEREHLTLPRYLAMVAGTLTPFLLFLHLIGSTALLGQGSPIALALNSLAIGNWIAGPGAALVVGAIALVAVIVIASILGLVIASAAPALGRALQTPAPIVSILVFGYTFYVTHAAAWWIATHPVAVLVRYVN